MILYNNIGKIKNKLMRLHANKKYTKTQKLNILIKKQEKNKQKREAYKLNKLKKIQEIQDSINKVLCQTDGQAFELFKQLYKNNEIKFVKNTESIQQLANKCIKFIPTFVLQTLHKINSFEEKRQMAKKLYNTLVQCGLRNTKLEQNHFIIQQAKEIAQCIANNDEKGALHVIKETEQRYTHELLLQQNATISIVFEEISELTVPEQQLILKI